MIMKACFFLQRRFAFLGHQMAVLLKEKYGLKEFCGYVCTRSSYNFLKSQNDIAYVNLLLEEDVYAQYKQEKIDINFLESFADTYGLPNLWPYILLDRILRYNQLLRAYPSDKSTYSHEDLVKVFQATAKAITKFLDEGKPDFIVFSVVSNLGSYLLYKIAKKKGIKTILFDDPRLGCMQTLSESFGEHTYIENTIKYMRQNIHNPAVVEFYKKAECFLKSFQKEPFYYMKDSEAASKFSQNIARPAQHFYFLLPSNLCRSVHWFFKSFYDYFLNKNKDKHDYSTVKPWWETWDKLARKLKILRGCKDLYDKPDFNEDYAYFALHAEPEAFFPFSAPFYTDQQWVIAQVARSLPLHYKLYVKDHPCMVGSRKLAYYKEIKKIPNVKLIDPTISSLELIQNSKLVTTVAGTAGWEGILFKKPVIIFGASLYHKLSMVKLCSDITKLPYLIKEQLEKFEYNEEELIYFIAGLYKESVPLDLSQIWDVEGASMMEKKKKFLMPLVDLLAKKIGLH